MNTSPIKYRHLATRTKCHALEMARTDGFKTTLRFSTKKQAERYVEMLKKTQPQFNYVYEV